MILRSYLYVSVCVFILSLPFYLPPKKREEGIKRQKQTETEIDRKSNKHADRLRKSQKYKETDIYHGKTNAKK